MQLQSIWGLSKLLYSCIILSAEIGNPLIFGELFQLVMLVKRD